MERRFNRLVKRANLELLGRLARSLRTRFYPTKPLTVSPFRRLQIVRHNVLYESREGT